MKFKAGKNEQMLTIEGAGCTWKENEFLKDLT